MNKLCFYNNDLIEMAKGKASSGELKIASIKKLFNTGSSNYEAVKFNGCEIGTNANESEVAQLFLGTIEAKQSLKKTACL